MVFDFRIPDMWCLRKVYYKIDGFWKSIREKCTPFRLIKQYSIALKLYIGYAAEFSFVIKKKKNKESGRVGGIFGRRGTCMH